MTKKTSLLLAALSALLIGSTTDAARRRTMPEGDEVELFAAMDAGQLEVKFIPKNAEQAMVTVANKTNRPLNIKLPAAFAGVPVLAQPGIGGVGGGVGGGRAGVGGFGGGVGGQTQQQGLGGGMGGGGMGMGGMGMGGGFMNVAPDRVGKVKVATVCLEHGKPDPNPRIPYELKRIESFTSNAAVIELCKMLGNREIDRASAQAAAWHLTDGLQWNELAQKVKVRHLNGKVELYFNRQQVQHAVQIVLEATRRAEKTQKQESPGEIADRQT